MTLCPIAMMKGCEKCVVFQMCPLKGVIGDYGKKTDQPPKQDADSSGHQKP